MKINKDVIAKMNPCNERFENYLSYYSNFDGTLKNFLALDKITFNDKVWVFVRLMSKSQNAAFAIKCAKAVLDIFESKYPSDLRPRKAIEAAETCLNYPSESNRIAADDATYAAANAAVYTAYAADAAANAADAAKHAATAATYAASTAEYAATAATYAASTAEYAAAATANAADAAAYAARTAAFSAAYTTADAVAHATTEMESKILQFMLEVVC